MTSYASASDSSSSTSSFSPLSPLSVLIFANGDLNDGPAVRAALQLPAPRLIIAADGGLRHVREVGLQPDLVIGDMDSVDSEDLRQVQEIGVMIERRSPQKDETDLELALIAAAAQHPGRIRIFAASGTRLDHTLSAVYLLALSALHPDENGTGEAAIDVAMVSHEQTIRLYRPGRFVLHGSAGDTVSLLPIGGDVTGITTQGLFYPLRGETLHFGPARGVSNVLTESSAEVHFEGGLLLTIHSANAHGPRR